MLYRLEALRINEQKRQDEVAEEIGFSTSRYSRIERGDTKIDIEEVLRICDHFGIDNPRDVQWYPKNKS